MLRLTGAHGGNVAARTGGCRPPMATPAPNVTLLDDHRRAPLLPMALRAPATAVRSVRRHALLERLQASTEPVVALSARAGDGKSTVLAQWAEADERPFAWVRGCDGAEPAMLLGYVAAALGELVDIPLGPASLPVVCHALTTIPRSYVIAWTESTALTEPAARRLWAPWLTTCRPARSLPSLAAACRRCHSHGCAQRLTCSTSPMPTSHSPTTRPLSF